MIQGFPGKAGVLSEGPLNTRCRLSPGFLHRLALLGSWRGWVQLDLVLFLAFGIICCIFQVRCSTNCLVISCASMAAINEGSG